MRYFALMKVRIISILILLSCLPAKSQDIPIYTQYFANPYLYNPAFAGYEGRPNFSLANRRQWVGIENAPITYNFTFHSPIVGGFNLGVNLQQDNYGIFQSNAALLTFGYNINLGFNHFLAFGLSGGVGQQRLDITGLDLNDPALGGVLDQNLYLDGNFGLAYHIAGFTISGALPRLFKTRPYPTGDFDTGLDSLSTLSVLRNWHVSVDYMIYFGADQYAFQPYVFLRSYESLGDVDMFGSGINGPQVEAGGIFHIKNTLWVGASYRDKYGAAGLLGIKLNGGFSAGYAYEMPIGNSSGVNLASHEIQLTFAFGQKNDRGKTHQTFIDSKRPIRPTTRKDPEPEPEEEPEPEPEEEQEPEPEIPAPTVAQDSVQTSPAEAEPIQEDAPVVIVPIIVDKEEREPVEEVEDVFPVADTTKTEPTAPVETPEEIEEPEVVEQPVEIVEQPVEVEEPPVVEETEALGEGPKVIARKGYHPFEMPVGHYVVVAAFGEFKNAVAYNDQLLADGYESDFGFNTDKKLFYVYIYYGEDANEARRMRNNARQQPRFQRAWYLLIK